MRLLLSYAEGGLELSRLLYVVAFRDLRSKLATCDNIRASGFHVCIALQFDWTNFQWN